ncbi:hypothetical protein CARUB_v10015803mg [Capsella rubella]|uniref:Uncharacterized protein n=1 Tax=Capsella rubella TaxID=81985 RepID=R0GA28_9BRAS|nr:hypothetical protein CARUB_v10015803mg [Capsella rubella]
MELYEEAAKHATKEDGSNDAFIPSRFVLNKEYLKISKSKNGYIYGLGSMHIIGMEKINEALKEHNEELKGDINVLKTGMDKVVDELPAQRQIFSPVLKSLVFPLPSTAPPNSAGSSTVVGSPTMDVSPPPVVSQPTVVSSSVAAAAACGSYQLWCTSLGL